MHEDGCTNVYLRTKVNIPDIGSGWLDAYPFRRDGLLKRIGPFAIVAFLAEASIALPPGPASSNYTVMSAILLFATVVTCLLPWDRLPAAWDVIVPLLYIASVLTLNLAAGGSTSGVGIVVLMPLVWTALYHRPYQSAIIVAAILVYELITSLIPVEITGAVMARRLVFWFAILTLLSIATHQLRSQIRTMLDQRQDLIEQRERALVDLTASFERLSRRDRESQLLVELSEIAQSSLTARQAGEATRDTLALLFDGGSVSVDNQFDDSLETAVVWGPDAEPGTSFSKSDCVALRTGQLHVSGGPEGECDHRVDPSASISICVPMMTQGEALGVFQVYSYAPLKTPSARDEVAAALSQLGLAVSEQISMALVNFRLRDTLREQSIRDPLTNLFNRRYMEETFHRELSRAARDHIEIGVMQIDIDFFKQFNDTHGHDVGDALLRAFADLLTEHFRDSDVPCRYGGEEFTLILINSPYDETEARARELQRSVLALTLDLGDGRTSPPPPTLSIGISSFPEHGNTAEALMRAADQALYAAKAQGRNTIVRAISVNAITAG
jgi:diguanylate cyclase (GGDEF)-like protein